MSAAGWRMTLVVGLGAGMLVAAPALASTRIEKQLALAAGGRLFVESEIGDVTVRGDAASGAAVVLTADRDDLEKDYDLRFEATPGEAHVVIKRRDRGMWFSGWTHLRDRAALAVSVPRATSATIHLSGGDIEAADLDGTADLRSSGGSINAHDLTGKVDARSSGGNVKAQDIHGDAHLSSSGGDIRASSVRGGVEASSSGGSVELDRVYGDAGGRSSGGDVTIREAGGRVVAGSSGGSVKVSFAAGNGRGGEIWSSGGDVEARIDPAVGLNLDAASSGGSVDCKLPVTVQGKISERHLQGVLKGGGERLKLRSSGGGVHIDSL